MNNCILLYVQKYERPPNKFTVSAKHQFANKESAHTSTKSSTLPRNIHSKNTPNQFGSHPKRANDDLLHRNHRNHDSSKLSQSPSKSELLREHVNSLQNTSTKAAMRVVNPPQLNNEPGIVDGYLENVSHFKTNHFCEKKKRLFNFPFIPMNFHYRVQKY